MRWYVITHYNTQPWPRAGVHTECSCSGLEVQPAVHCCGGGHYSLDSTETQNLGISSDVLCHLDMSFNLKSSFSRCLFYKIMSVITFFRVECDGEWEVITLSAEHKRVAGTGQQDEWTNNLYLLGLLWLFVHIWQFWFCFTGSLSMGCCVMQMALTPTTNLASAPARLYCTYCNVVHCTVHPLPPPRVPGWMSPDYTIIPLTCSGIQRAMLSAGLISGNNL